MGHKERRNEERGTVSINTIVVNEKAGERVQREHRVDGE